MMRANALVSGLILALVIGVAQQQAPTPQKKPSTGNDKSAPAQNAPKNAPPKEGSLRVKGESIRFFSRGEGTLTIKGHGFVLVGDLQGEIIPQGFRELKKLPRGVTLDPPMDKRIRIFHGKGTITIKGKYDSMKVALHTAEIEFRGGASFDIQGVGKGVRDGREEVVLYPSAVFTLIVPKPEGQAQPQAEEPKSVPEVRPLQPKAPQQQPNKKEAAK